MCDRDSSRGVPLKVSVSRLALLIAVVVTSATCDSPAGPPQVAYIQVTPRTWNPIALGDTARFTAVAQTWLRREIPDQPVTWSSDAPDIVFVGPDGSAVAHETGVAQVRATVGAVSGSASVSVVQIIAAVEILTYFGNTVAAGDSLKLYIDARDRNAFSIPGTTFTLQSLNQSIATVTLGGWVKGISPGEANIIAMAGGRADTAPVIVHP